MSQINIKQIIGASQGSILFLGTNSVVSEDFNNLNWNQSNNILYINGNLQIADGNQQSGYVLVSDDNGLATWTQSLSAGTGSAGQVSFWSGTSSQIGDNGLFWNNTDKRLGIGTTTPTAKINIINDTVTQDFRIERYGFNSNIILGRAQGTISSPTNVTTNATIGNISAIGYASTNWGTASPQIRFVSSQNWSDTQQGSRITLWTTENDTITAAERLRIENNGNVGIGTTSPNSTLHISAAPAATEQLQIWDCQDAPNQMFRILNATSAANRFIPMLRAENSDNNNIALFLATQIGGDVDTGTNPLIIFQGRTITSGTVSTRPLFDFRNHNTSRMIMLANGNVGIGTNTPTEKLDVNGNVKLNAFGSDIPLLINRRALGTEASPTAITTGQGLFVLQTQGYNGSAYQTARDNIVITAAENWTTTANGTAMRFSIVTNGTTTNRNALRIYNNTDIVFGSMAAIPSLGGYDKVIASQLETTGKLMNMLYTNDGTRNRRIGLFLDDVNNEYGFDFSKVSGTDIPFVIKNAGIENFRITPTGNVGIGTQTPTEKLDVNGNVKATRFIGVSDIQRMPFKQNTDIAHTGTLTNTIISSYLIPAGTFDLNDILRFRLTATQTNNANVKTIRVYVNSSVSLSGATLVATRSLTNSAGSSLARDLVFKNSLSSQNISVTTGNVGDDENNSNVSISTLSIDFTIDQYFIVAVELADVTDTVTLRWLRSQILR